MSPQLLLARSFAQHHPEELSRLAERLGPEAHAELLAVLSHELAASVLACTMPLTAARVLGLLEHETALGVLGAMDPRAAAQALLRVPREERERLYQGLPAKLERTLRTLTAYGDGVAGGRMDPAVHALPITTTPSDALEQLRSVPAGTPDYCYAIDAQGRLVGVASLKELVLAPASATLASVMSRSPTVLYADDPLPLVVSHAGWRRHHALPVVDRQGRLLGAVRYSAFRAIETELGKRLPATPGNAAASALAELCGLGLVAVSRLAGVAFDRTSSGSVKS